MKFVLLSLIFLFPLSAIADEPRHNFVFKSSNDKYELRHVKGPSARQKWALIDKSTGRVRYQLTAELSSMTVLVSDNGNALVAVDDYSEGEPSKDLAVLLFFREGKQIKTYMLGELLNDASNISSSVSHFTWFFPRELLSINDSKITLTTYELAQYSFDIETGKVIKKERDVALSDGALYIYGKVRNLGKGRYQMEVCHLVQGAVPESGKVEFEATGENVFRDDSYYTVIVRDGRLVTKKGITLNSCNYRTKKPAKGGRA